MKLKNTSDNKFLLDITETGVNLENVFVICFLRQAELLNIFFKLFKSILLTRWEWRQIIWKWLLLPIISCKQSGHWKTWLWINPDIKRDFANKRSFSLYQCFNENVSQLNIAFLLWSIWCIYLYDKHFLGSFLFALKWNATLK